MLVISQVNNVFYGGGVGCDLYFLRIGSFRRWFFDVDINYPLLISVSAARRRSEPTASQSLLIKSASVAL